jgi:hypothetical protein
MRTLNQVMSHSPLVAPSNDEWNGAQMTRYYRFIYLSCKLSRAMLFALTLMLATIAATQCFFLLPCCNA